MARNILLILLIVVAQSMKGNDVYELLILNLSTNFDTITDSSSAFNNELNTFDINELNDYLDSVSSVDHQANSNIVIIPERFHELFRMLLLVTDLDSKGINVIPADYNIVSDKINQTLYSRGQAQISAIMRSRLPYIKAWLSQNKEFIDSEIINGYINYRGNYINLFLSNLQNQDDIILDFYLSGFEYSALNQQSAEFFQAYLNSYDQAMELRDIYFQRKYSKGHQ